MLIESKYALFRTKILLGESSPLWQEDKIFIDLFSEIHEYSLLSPERLFQIYQYARNAGNLEGQYAQVGVLKGGSALLISMLMPKQKKLFLFDTFEGLPETNQEYDLYSKGKFDGSSLEFVQNLFSKSDKSVSIHQGIFPKSAQKEHMDSKYAFVYLDVDIYDSNLEALEFFYPRLTQGGYILMDDYEWNNTPGIKTSVAHFIKKYNLPEPIITTKYQCLIQKI